MTTLTNGNDLWAGVLYFDDVVEALDGLDVLGGGGGNDLLFGGAGDDFVFGEEGDDELHGQGDRDFLAGGAGADDLFGGAQDDELHSNGDDGPTLAIEVLADAHLIDAGGILDGGTGNDTITTTHDFSGTMTIIGGDNTDLLRFGGDRNAFAGGPPTNRFNTVDLETQSGTTPFGSAMSISGIENVDGDDYRDIFRGDNGINILRGFGGDDRLEGRGGADTLNGGAGAHDVADYSSSLDVDVDLQRATQIGNDAQGDVLSGIEDIDGSFFSDTLRGDGNANSLYGNNGSDRLEGRGGADTLHGGGNIDAASYESSNAGVQVALDDPNFGVASSASGGHATGDILISIENLIGSAHNDLLVGNSIGNRIEGGNGIDEIYGLAGADTLLGDAGNDTLVGNEGNDTIDGGFGSDVLAGEADTDTVSFESWDPTGIYSPALESIRIALNQGNAQGTATRTFLNLTTGTSTVLETDTLSGFENVRGSDRAETIVGNSGANVLEGRGSSDLLEGRGGSDTLDGGSGIDTASYETHTGRVFVTLADGAAAGSASETGTLNGQLVVLSTDTLRNIENVRGSAFADGITGNSGANVLDGQGGADTMNGGGGDDIYIVDNPADLVGEAGGQGVDRVRTSVTYALGAASEIEALETTNQSGTTAINLIGNGINNTITGNNGGNTISGGGGFDTIFGHDGVDVIIGGAAQDTMFGGAGADTFRFVALSDAPVAGVGFTDYLPDFSEAQGDRIDLAAIDANALVAGDQAFTPIGVNVAFNRIAGELRFNSGFLEGDVNGDAVADFRIDLDVAVIQATSILL